MSTTSYAVLAKARAKFGRFLSEHDYDGILACQSVPEVMVYLKTYTHFAPVLSGVDEREVHRGRLEALLRQYQFNEFDSLCRYDSNVSEGFSRYIIEKSEVEQIVHFIVLLNAHSTEKFMFRFPAFLTKHTELDFERLATVHDYSGFLDALSRTSYYEILKGFRPDLKGRLPVADIENRLSDLVLKHMIEFINKKTKGSERRELTDIFEKLNDYNMISRIIRLKRYYHMPPEEIRATVTPEFSGLSPELIDRMCEAQTADDVYRIVRDTKYGRLIGGSGTEYQGDIGPRVQYKIARQKLHFSNNPSVVMISFMFLSEAELMNVICLIEGVRYQVDPKTIRSMLIR